jgi:hypothetical protein
MSHPELRTIKNKEYTRLGGKFSYLISVMQNLIFGNWFFLLSSGSATDRDANRAGTEARTLKW